jgi:hypothetical protein
MIFFPEKVNFLEFFNGISGLWTSVWSEKMLYIYSEDYSQIVFILVFSFAKLDFLAMVQKSLIGPKILFRSLPRKKKVLPGNKSIFNFSMWIYYPF